eukprot:TRINITY_DN18425_c0_g1_i1.p1 TRINITY_DN18425_c0_g1~~TRINITY_DN18425_c0_g1_i1.p1  ORF type:complete len:224 (-),score=35.67 TRINITY_DN18425_c0_g1_i1:68-739(-)
MSQQIEFESDLNQTYATAPANLDDYEEVTDPVTGERGWKKKVFVGGAIAGAAALGVKAYKDLKKKKQKSQLVNEVHKNNLNNNVPANVAGTAATGVATGTPQPQQPQPDQRPQSGQQSYPGQQPHPGQQSYPGQTNPTNPAEQNSSQASWGRYPEQQGNYPVHPPMHSYSNQNMPMAPPYGSMGSMGCVDSTPFMPPYVGSQPGLQNYQQQVSNLQGSYPNQG